MYKQIEQDKVFNFLNKIVEMVESFREEVASTSTQTVEETTATVGETEIIEHEGLKLRKVDREAREGDYIRQTAETSSDYIFKNEVYGPVKNGQIQDKRCSFDWEVYNDKVNRTPSTVEVFEVVGAIPREIAPDELPFPEVELTANQKRAALIEQAKKFVEEHSKNFKFIKQDNLIVALNRKYDGKKQGYSCCNPQDVFNEHIGKAIALARALEIDVPEEFLEAVQPIISIGQKIMVLTYDEKFDGKIDETWVQTVVKIKDNGHPVFKNGMRASHYQIIDDTNAQYKVTKC